MSRADCLPALAKQAPVVLPSLLLCDFGNLEREVAKLEEAGAKALHLDIMDGHFVPNFTYGLTIVDALRQLTELPLDTHLMISHPERYVEAFYRAGADIITTHIEATRDPQGLIQKIHKLGAGAGIAVNPGTPLTEIEDVVWDCDLVLIMSVNPGFGGQKFNSVAVEKLKLAREMTEPGTILEVDGGISELTIGCCAEAGAQLFVVGSAIFCHTDYRMAIDQLTYFATRH